MNFEIIQQFPTISEGKNELIRQGVDVILSGEQDLLTTMARLRHVEDIVDAIKNDGEVKILLERELAKYGKGERATALGYEIASSDRSAWDFTGCGDIVLEDLKKEEAGIKEKIKAREGMLKALTQPVCDSENGGHMIGPPIRKVSTIFSYKQAKEVPGV